MNEIDTIIAGSQLKKLIEKQAVRLTLKYNLRPVELDIISFLYVSGNMDTAKDIMTSKRLSKAHISKSLDNLHSKGFIIPVDDKYDHRKVHIKLTESAKQAAKEAIAEKEKCRNAALRGLSADEIIFLQRVTDKILHNIDIELNKIDN